MNTRTRLCFASIALAFFGLASAPALFAQDAPATPRLERPVGDAPEAPDLPDAVDVEAPDVETPDAATADTDAETAEQAEEPIVWTRDRARGGRRHFQSANEIVSFGSSSRLAQGERADAVVSIFGSSTSAGEVREAVVSVFGNTRVEGGTVGEAAVAVLGDTYVNATIDGDVVAVLGDVELGPQANVRGNVVVVGGTLTRDPEAQVRGGVQHVMAMPEGALSGFRAWLENCLRYLRPLAFAPGLDWAWTIALGFLALYAVMALMLREPVDRCVKTLQEHPGKTILASLLATVLTPVLFVVLAITIIGIAFIPVASFGIFLATLFGKAVVLAWIGRGLFKLFDTEQRLHTALAVLAGGAIVLLLYVVPVLGFLLFKLLGMLAFGVVLYTLLLAAQARRPAPPTPSPAQGGGPTTGGGPSTSPEPSASAAAFAPAGTASTSGMASTGGEPAGAAPAGAAAGGGSAASTASAPPPPPPPPPPQSAPLNIAGLERAGFWIRMLALFIDATLIGFAVAVITRNEGQLFLAALAAYGAIMWKTKGTTIGGLVCNLKVARLDGQPIDWSTAIVRALSCFLSLIIFGLGFIWIAFDDGKQAWHDKIAGTVVVRVPQGISLL